MGRTTYRGSMNSLTAVVVWFPDRGKARVVWGGQGRPDGRGASVVEVDRCLAPFQEFQIVDGVARVAPGSPVERSVQGFTSGKIPPPAVWKRHESQPPAVGFGESPPMRFPVWSAVLLGLVFSCALVMILGYAVSLAAATTSSPVSPVAPPTIRWVPPGESDVATSTDEAIAGMGCSSRQSWTWTSAREGSTWVASALDCGDPGNASRWAATVLPRDLAGYLTGRHRPPGSLSRANDRTITSWSQGSYWLSLSVIGSPGDAELGKVAQSLASAVGEPVNPNPAPYPILMIGGALMLVMGVVQFVWPRGRDLRGVIAGIMRAYEDPSPHLPSNYEDADVGAPAERLGGRLGVAADIALVVGEALLGVIALRFLGVGLWLGVALCAVGGIAVLVVTQKLSLLLQSFRMPPLMPIPIESASRRIAPFLGRALSIGVRATLGVLVWGGSFLMADLALSTPLPVLTSLRQLQEGGPWPWHLWAQVRASLELFIGAAPVTGSLVIVAIGVLVVALWRLAESWQAIFAQERVAIPDMPPMLYLRSFDEDALTVDMRDLSQSWAERLLGRRRLRYEELMTKAAAVLGPVDAVIDPRSKALLAPGAARLLPTGDWRDTVREHARGALCVIVSATPDAVGDGFAWELLHLAEEVGHSRFCFLIAPWPIDERRRRLSLFLDAANDRGLLGGLTLDMVPETTRVIVGTSDGSWAMIGSSRADGFSCAYSLLLGFLTMGEAWLAEAARKTPRMSWQRRESFILLREPPDIPLRTARFLFWLYRTIPPLGRAIGYFDE